MAFQDKLHGNDILVGDDGVFELGPNFDLLKNPPVTYKFYCGWDIGRTYDSTYGVVIQRKDIDFKGQRSTEFDVVDVVRIKNKPNLIEQAEEIAKYQRQSYFQNHETKFRVDKSGLGSGLFDHLKLNHRDLKPFGVTITSGEGKNRSKGTYSRNYLINLVRNWIFKPNFRISTDLPEAKTLRSQIESIQEKETAAGNLIYEVTGHDDALMALALALIPCDYHERLGWHNSGFAKWLRGEVEMSRSG